MGASIFGNMSYKLKLLPPIPRRHRIRPVLGTVTERRTPCAESALVSRDLRQLVAGRMSFILFINSLAHTCLALIKVAKIVTARRLGL